MAKRKVRYSRQLAALLTASMIVPSAAPAATAFADDKASDLKNVGTATPSDAVTILSILQISQTLISWTRISYHRKPKSMLQR